MNNFNFNANQRSFESSMAPVVNESSAKQTKSSNKKVKRNLFTVAKNKINDEFKKVYWVVETINPDLYPEDIYRICAKHVCKEMDSYNYLAFCKDLALRMHVLLDKRSFQNYCKTARKSMFYTAQVCALAKDSVYKEIATKGILSVGGFWSPFGDLVYEATGNQEKADRVQKDVQETSSGSSNFAAYRYAPIPLKDLQGDLAALEWDEKFWNDDPYSEYYWKNHKDEKDAKAEERA